MTNKHVLYAVAFLIGATVMSYEILGVRALAPYYGSSVHVWGAIISVFLAGLAIGYALGGSVADRRADMKSLRRALLPPALLIAAFPLYGPEICGFIYELGFSARPGALLLAGALFLPPCIFLGAALPVLVKMRAADSHKIGSAAGNVYAMSTAGSIAGTLFTSFFLISLLGLGKCFTALGGLLLGCWLLCLAFSPKRKK